MHLPELIEVTFSNSFEISVKNSDIIWNKRSLIYSFVMIWPADDLLQKPLVNTKAINKKPGSPSGYNRLILPADGYKCMILPGSRNLKKKMICWGSVLLWLTILILKRSTFDHLQMFFIQYLLVCLPKICRRDNLSLLDGEKSSKT